MPVLFSCTKNFLDHTPSGSLNEEVVASKKGVANLLIGAYAALDGQQGGAGDMSNLNGGDGFRVSPDNFIYGAIAGGDAHKGSEAGDVDDILSIAGFQANASSAFFNDKWKCDFEGIKRCNTVLSTLKITKDMSDAEKTEAAAEARFLRGHYYFDLRKMFKMIPWVDEDTTSLLVKNDKEIYPNIEADFKYAMENLPANQSDVGRVNKWAAQIYLAKTFLYEKNYTDALPLFTEAINSGETSNGLKYDLVPFQNNFDAATENNAESVFAIQNTANDGSGSTANANQGDMLNYPYGGPFSCCGFFQPSFDLVNSYRTDPNGLPYLDTYNSHEVKSDMKIASSAAFTPDAGTLDPRLDWTVGRRGIPFLDWGNHPGADWVRSQTYAGPYSPKKNVWRQATQDLYYDANSWAPGTAINTLLIRFSDVLLMAAECEVQAGTLPQAEAYVNRVRNRAADPKSWVYKYKDDTKPTGGYSTTPAANYLIKPYASGAFVSKDFANKAIQFERKLELAMEGHRFFDLVRWGTAETVMNAYFTYESGKTTDIPSSSHFTNPRSQYYPIPQRQIDLSVVNGQPTLQQNY